jgi:hypothetical protein
MAILQVDTLPVESALQRRLRNVPSESRAAVAGTYRPVLGRTVFVYDIPPVRVAACTERPRRGFWRRLIA